MRCCPWSTRSSCGRTPWRPAKMQETMDRLPRRPRTRRCRHCSPTLPRVHSAISPRCRIVRLHRPRPAVDACTRAPRRAAARNAGGSARVLARLDDVVSPATMAMAGPRFFGFVIGGALPGDRGCQLAGHGLGPEHRPACRRRPALAQVEQVALRWLLDVLDLPRDCAGAFVTGATVANLTALAAARHRVLARAGWNVEADGLFGAPPITVIVGEEVHPDGAEGAGRAGPGTQRA